MYETVGSDGVTCDCSEPVGTYDVTRAGRIICVSNSFRPGIISTVPAPTRCTPCPDPCATCANGTATLRAGWRLNTTDPATTSELLLQGRGGHWQFAFHCPTWGTCPPLPLAAPAPQDHVTDESFLHCAAGRSGVLCSECGPGVWRPPNTNGSNACQHICGDAQGHWISYVAVVMFAMVFVALGSKCLWSRWRRMQRYGPSGSGSGLARHLLPADSRLSIYDDHMQNPASIDFPAIAFRASAPIVAGARSDSVTHAVKHPALTFVQLACQTLLVIPDPDP
jgi:hypothetical protein